MHDAGPLLAADAAEIVDVVQQRVDERAAGMPGRRMHDHARRLVDDDQVVVLVEDGQRQRFGLRRRVDRLRDVDADLPGPVFTGWFAFAARPSTWTWPSLISRWICDREWSGSTDTRKRSRRSAVAVVGTVNV